MQENYNKKKKVAYNIILSPIANVKDKYKPHITFQSSF